MKLLVTNNSTFMNSLNSSNASLMTEMQGDIIKLKLDFVFEKPISICPELRSGSVLTGYTFFMYKSKFIE